MTCSASKCRSSTERRPARLEEIGLPCHGTFLAQIAVGDLDVAVLGQLPAAQLSLDDKLRIRTGLTDDGNTLIDRALAGDPPLLAINPLKTESERSEQKGFANLVRGTFGMFRNTTAHEARIPWPIGQDDAEDPVVSGFSHPQAARCRPHAGACVIVSSTFGDGWVGGAESAACVAES